MIVIEKDGGAMCVGQAAHAWISGQLARAWGNDRFAAPTPLHDVCLGAEQHDVGMAEWDLAPTLNAETGLPCSFLQMPLATHLELWSAAPHKVVSQSPYAALLVSMHGHALYARRDTTEPGPEDSGAIRSFLAEQEAFQRDVLDHLGEDPERARRNQKLVWAIDFLSLALFMEQWIPDDVPTPEGTDLHVAPADGGITVDPWPFSTPTVPVRCYGRRIEGGHATEAELHAALAAARWETLSFELAPPAA
jgi:hypothetical protein